MKKLAKKERGIDTVASKTTSALVYAGVLFVLAQSYHSWNASQANRQHRNGIVFVADDSNLLEADNSLFCPSVLINTGAKSSSTSHVWNKLKHQIVNASYGVLPSFQSLDGTMAKEYTRWVDSIFSFYTAPRLRRSVMRPAPPEEIIRIMKLAAEIKRHNALVVSDDDDDGDTTTKKRSLRVLALGGSVTVGVGCQWPDNLGMPKTRHWSIPGEKCSWPYHLERILDQVLFEGEEIVTIDNMANGGVSSEFGALAMEYQLFPDPDRVPDIVISAFSANDAQEPDSKKVFYEHLQNFVKAARHLRPCDNDAPLVIMLDDLYGDVPPSVSLEQTGNIYMVSHWNNLMAVDYSGTVKYKILVEDTTWAPLLSSNFQMHNGIGMHMGIAWTIVFNVLDSMVNVCNDAEITSIRRRDREHNREHDAEDNAEDDPDNALGLAIDPYLLPNLEKGEPPIQQFGKVLEKKGDPDSVRREFEENRNGTTKLCHELRENNNKSQTSPSSSSSSSTKCSWSWFYNRFINFVNSKQVRNKMNEVLLFNDGWLAEGYPVRQPRSGWYTHSPNSVFSMKLENIPASVNYVVILAMKSYSSKWVGSKLAISTTVVNDSVIPDTETNHASRVNWDGNEDSIFRIDGYHKTRTSVHFPHKVPIQGGASPGDSIIIDAKLTGGSEFKIAGIAFCQY
mmetsp:Transcript_12790/g.26120  ORF Transcript_12790/g.26120 Transcript_12790/m.26120 type:complete len:678 (-) Transcript_12790:370-2403(-)